MNYYNENDKKAAAWLRELIKAGHIAPGEVDERSITDVQPNDLVRFTQCHFFAGIGGWSYALRLAGWPDDEPCWTGSCPCQPFSGAGKGLAEKDKRHLWPELFRLITQCKPATIFGEQVASFLGRLWLDGVRADLEALAYEVGAADLCAAGISAPHIRQRIYWVADSACKQAYTADTQRLYTESGSGGVVSGLVQSDSPRWDAGQSSAKAARYRDSIEPAGTTCGMADNDNDGPHRPEASQAVTSSHRQDGRIHSGGFSNWSDWELLHFTDGKTRRIESGTFPLAHGIPHRVGLLRGYGNAIVPQLAAEFIQAYQEAVLTQNS